MNDDRAQKAATDVAKEDQLVGSGEGTTGSNLAADGSADSGGSRSLVDIRRRFGGNKVDLYSFAKILGITYQGVLKLIKTGVVKTADWENILLIDTNANESVIEAYTTCKGAVQIAREFGISPQRVRRVATEAYIIPTHYRGASRRNPVWDKVSADAIRRILKQTLDGAGDTVLPKG